MILPPRRARRRARCVLSAAILLAAALPPGLATAQEAPAPASSGGQASNYFNPSISVIGNFLAVAGHNAVENLPNFSLRESEVGLQATVDPYAKADFFVSFADGGVEVEEGFITFTSLPADLLAKVGRVKVPFGRVNTMHPHVLPWPDEPLPNVNLLGGEEGWKGDGVVVARLLPIGDTFTELTLPGSTTRRRRGSSNRNAGRTSPGTPTARLFRDLTEDTNLDLGLSYGQGPNGTETGKQTRSAALDVIVRWKPLVTASYRSLVLRGRVDPERAGQPGRDGDRRRLVPSGEWQLDRRWFAGVALRIVRPRRCRRRIATGAKRSP